MHLPERRLASENIFSGKVIRVSLDKVSLINNKTATREVVHHKGAVCIAAITPDNELIFVKQYRYPIKKFLLELPAGKLENSEDPLGAGVRELREETGTIGKNYVSLGQCYSDPGFCSEIIHIFLCSVDTYTEPDPDDDEFLEIIKIPIEKAYNMVLTNEICDTKTQIGVLKTYLYLKNGLY